LNVCSKECRSAQIKAQRKKRKSCATITLKMAEALWKRDQGLCGLCGVPVLKNAPATHPRKLQYDHIIPISKNGMHDVSNLQLSCRACNIWKSNKVLVIGGSAFSAIAAESRSSQGNKYEAR
jgi:5-methylcytosine-specific restriction endonuclease McrA